jgi:hypothetical protein
MCLYNSGTENSGNWFYSIYYIWLEWPKGVRMKAQELHSSRFYVTLWAAFFCNGDVVEFRVINTWLSDIHTNGQIQQVIFASFASEWPDNIKNSFSYCIVFSRTSQFIIEKHGQFSVSSRAFYFIYIRFNNGFYHNIWIYVFLMANSYDSV